jgi:hypothetical protein
LFLESYGIESGFLRTDFGKTINEINLDSNQGISIYYIISTFPLLIRVPLSFILYFLSPLFGSVPIIAKGILQPINFLYYLHSLVFLFFLPSFFNGIFVAFKVRNIRFQFIVVTYIYLLLMLSISSMQIRHKIILEPLFLLIAFYGIDNDRVLYFSLFKLGTFMFIIFQLVYFII